ncbi:hypothetical protein KY347_04905 [Candidatus Woesearchaeota archaeon]|nr:hypothetical protein [Candidatus Woesearchaeota archaeon]
MSKFKQVLLAVAIAIVLAFFVGFGIAAFYEEPEYEDFCGNVENKQFFIKEECEANGGKWSEYGERPLTLKENQYLCTKGIETGTGEFTFNCQTSDEEARGGYCDVTYTCRTEFEGVREVYNRNVFIIATIFGLIALITGFFLKVSSVSAGMMGGGILTVFYGIIRYWSGLQNYGRFTVLGIALAILIWLGYKKLKS